MQTKICTKCGEEKPATSEFFYKDKKGICGIASFCKLCRNSQNEYYYIKNKNKILLKNRISYHEDIEKSKRCCRKYRSANREKEIERGRLYRENNKDKELLRCKLYREKNKEKVKNSASRWKKENKHKANADTKKRRALKQRALPNLSKQEHKQITQLYNQAQALSKSDMFNAYHVDHIVPLQGKLPDGKRVLGAHRLSNLQLLMDCVNIAKLNRITYKDLKKAKEGVDYIFVPDDYHDDPNKYPEIGFDVELCFN